MNDKREDEKESENLFEIAAAAANNESNAKDVEIVGKKAAANLVYRGIIITCILVIFLSLSNVFIRNAQFFSGIEQTAIGYTMQLVVSLSIALYNRENIFGPPDKRKMLIIRGVLGIFGLITLHLAVKFINPSDTVYIFHTKVILGVFIARFTLNEKFSFFHVVALFMVVSGTYFLFEFFQVLSFLNPFLVLFI